MTMESSSGMPVGRHLDPPRPFLLPFDGAEGEHKTATPAALAPRVHEPLMFLNVLSGPACSDLSKDDGGPNVSATVEKLPTRIVHMFPRRDRSSTFQCREAAAQSQSRHWNVELRHRDRLFAFCSRCEICGLKAWERGRPARRLRKDGESATVGHRAFISQRHFGGRDARAPRHAHVTSTQRKVGEPPSSSRKPKCLLMQTALVWVLPLPRRRGEGWGEGAGEREVDGLSMARPLGQKLAGGIQ